MTRVVLICDEFPDQTLVARAPPDRQPPPELLLDPPHLIIQFASRQTVDRSSRHGVHGGEFEEPDGFFDVMGLDGRRKCHFG